MNATARWPDAVALDKETVLERLPRVLARHIESDFSIEALDLLTGGSAAQTWRVRLSQNGASSYYILRLAQGEAMFNLGLNKTQEAQVQMQAVAHGVLAPSVFAVLEESDELGDGFVMAMLEGETIPQKILRRDEYAVAREQLAAQCGKALAKIHAVPTDELRFLPDLSTAPQLDALWQLYEHFDQPSAVFEYAFRWLRLNLPADEQGGQTLVHGDFRNGNLMVNEHGLVSILDWELAHLGDPLEDLAWLCMNSWRFGERSKPVGGFGQREQLYQAYEAGGGSVDRLRLHYWEVLGVLKWGLICLYQCGVHLSGEERSVNLAAIGRRVSETELDLISLFEERRSL